VWSFTVEPALYPIENISATASVPTSAGASGPEATVDGSGLDGEGHHSIDETAMWLADITPGEPVYIQYDFDRLYKVYEMHIWNYNGLYEGFLGFGLKDITIEYAVEPNEWTTLGDFELARATSRATYAGENIEVGGLAMRSVRITASSNLGVQLKYGLSEVQFLHKPTFAREPQPADGATDVYRATALGWRPGREAASHQVYFDTDEDAVAGGTAPSQTVMVNTYSPGALNLGTAYFWRVDEVNDAEAPTTWDSGVWSFITQEYISIDDFESYTDEQGSQIFETWMDGYEIGDNGSLVGHENPPFAEKTVVNGGLQSMPLYYNNIGGVANSEAKLVFASPQNWTTNGADTLSLYFRGDPVEFIETSPGNIIMSGTGADIYQLTDEFRYAYKQLTGNGSITARVDTIQYTNEWAKAGVMMRATLESGTMQAHMIAAPSNRVEWMPRLTAGSDATGTATAVDSTPLPQWVRVTRVGNAFTGEYSADGQTWETVTGTTPATIEMPETIYIGLVVSSHVAGIPCAVEFSSVSTVGNVTAEWQLADVGVAQPTGNELDTFYIAVEDSSGMKATLTNPDPYAVAAPTWQHWLIPFSDLTAAGVRINSIKTLYIGVGDKSQPSQNAAGRLYIDDIGFGHPIPTE
jgi:regulation of enolase protein 1 (concanavalin A-like superfamily)